MNRETYVLTDGVNVYDEREMDVVELDNATADCEIATAGNVWWRLKDKIEDTKASKALWENQMETSRCDPAGIRNALERAYTCIFPQNPDDRDLDEAGERIRGAIVMIANMAYELSPKYKDLQRQLQGADAMISAIEDMFPRHHVYRDLAEAVQVSDEFQKKRIKNLQMQVQQLSEKLFPGCNIPADQYYNYLAVVAGGRGPDAWDKEISVSAPSMVWAVRLIHEMIIKEDAAIISIEQVE